MKVSLLILLLSISTGALAKTVARVLEINGNAFVFYGKKDSKKLFYGDKIEDMSEVMVDDSSSVSLKDEYGRIYHLAGGSYIKLFNNLVELKNGNVWVSSTKSQNYGVINSVNSIAKFTQGQFIYSFDNIAGKSQVLVLTGDVIFSNVVESNLNVKVPAGHFSFVDQTLANGLPRGATRVGLASYKQVKSLFSEVKALEKTSFDKALFGAPTEVKRGIASVPSTDSSAGKKGKLIFVESGGSRGIASVSHEVSAYDYYKQIKKSPSKPQKTGKVAKVRMFGFSGDVAAPKKQASVQKPVQKVAPVVKKVVKAEPVQEKKAPQRVPASVERTNLIQDISSRGAFETSLQEASKENTRHPKEVNELINELNSYDQTYQDDY